MSILVSHAEPNPGHGIPTAPGARCDILTKLETLRTELADLAFKLESRGRLDAADLAMSVAARVGELCEELAPPDRS